MHLLFPHTFVPADPHSADIAARALDDTAAQCGYSVNEYLDALEAEGAKILDRLNSGG